MTAPHADQIINEYISRLERALDQVPDGRRQELLDEVRAHIAEARTQLSDETDVEVLNILDRLGDPTETAAAELGRIDLAPADRQKAPLLEIATIVLLLLVWPVGVVLLWISSRWTTRDKLIGTFVPPGGYLGTLVVGSLLALGAVSTMCRTMSDESGRVLSTTCPSGGSQLALNVGAALLLIVYILGPILTAAYLALRVKRRSPGLNRAAQAGIAPTLS
jgi:uncharacterized membrane protein